MNYGPHTADVLDFADFIMTGRLLRDPRPPHDPGLRIIRDLSEADRYREVQEDTPDDRWSWRDILEYGGACGSDLPIERTDRRRAVPGLTDSLSRLVNGGIANSLNEQLEGRYSDDEILYILGNIDFILLWRATYGRAIPFIEQLIELYRVGGYPCGWDGIHPEGRLVVYFPPDGFSSDPGPQS